jgi:hypothetical protein
MNPSILLFNPLNSGQGQRHACVKGQIHEMETLLGSVAAKKADRDLRRARSLIEAAQCPFRFGSWPTLVKNGRYSCQPLVEEITLLLPGDPLRFRSASTPLCLRLADCQFFGPSFVLSLVDRQIIRAAEGRGTETKSGSGQIRRHPADTATRLFKQPQSGHGKELVMEIGPVTI